MTPKRGDATLEVVKDDRELRTHTPVPLALEPEGGSEPSFAEYLAIVFEARWLVAAVLAAVLAAGASYALVAAPVYRSDVLLQVEAQKGGLGGLGELSTLFSDASPAETEIEILRSRSVVGDVVDALHLEIVAAPRRFPLVGSAIARRRGGAAPASAILGLSSYAWGGERISVTRLDVPEALVGEKLTLVARGGGRYEVRDPDGATLLGGEVGKAASGGGVSTFVTELAARERTRFTLVRRARDGAVEDLQRDLKVAEKGKKTGILQISLDGRDRAQVPAILDALARAYVRQNVERRSAEAAQTLAFLEQQLPSVRASLDAAEVGMREYMSRHGSVDVGLEAQAAITRAADIEKAATELQLERAALRQRFTESHPAIQAVQQKLDRLRADRTALEDRLRRLPDSELESARHMRDVKVATELYMTLLNKSEELKVVKSGTIGSVRILDAAVSPMRPVHPKPAMVLALSLLLGGALGLAAAFGRHALTRGVEDPEEIERTTGIAVYASIPHSASQAHMARDERKHGQGLDLVAVRDPKDLSVESLRSLRTSIQFGLLEARNNVIAIGGPAPGVGKSFVAANLAHLLGEQGRRVLLLDADLRRGHLHRYFGHPRSPGLSELIRGTATLEEASGNPSPDVTFVGTGTIPPNPAELLGSERFQRLLADVSAKFDVVLVDTPPILAVTDAALVARHAGVNLFVLKAGTHPMREIQHAVRVLARGGIRIQGLVLNDVRLEHGILRKGGYHYQYEYE